MTFLDFWYNVQFNLYTSTYLQSTWFGGRSAAQVFRLADFSFTTFGCAADRLVAVIMLTCKNKYQKGIWKILKNYKILSTCDFQHTRCNLLFMSTCNLFISTCKIDTLGCNLFMLTSNYSCHYSTYLCRNAT
jgi:hypothetical protein